MSNDLSRGLFPAKEVKLLVVDEAHRAQGEYAYCQVASDDPLLPFFVLQSREIIFEPLFL